jgi:hypothetical protein
MRTTALRAGLAAAVLAGLTAFAVPATAQAADTNGARTPATATATTTTTAADGNFYAYEFVGGMGEYCAWAGDDANWSTCSPRGGIRNQASSVENRGFPGAYEDVLVYWDNADDAGGWDGARACVQNGWSYGHLYQYEFPANGEGGGEKMDQNISAHRWVHSCTEDPM